jgi:hypothetical protein
VDPFVVLLAAAGAAVAVWFFAKPNAVFIIRIRNGNAVATSGHVTPAFLAAIGVACREFALPSGEVWGVARGTRILLRFTSNFPPAARQRLRNWWVEHGWSLPSRRPHRR